MISTSVLVAILSLLFGIACYLASKSFEHGLEVSRNRESIAYMQKQIRRLERHAGFTE